MFGPVKFATLHALRKSGVFRLVANSNWRQQRLLILCYHGFALEDEHHWRPGLYMPVQELGRHRVVRALIDAAESENMTGLDKDDLAARLARLLKIDYGRIKTKRILQLMNAHEVREVAESGIDIQLHTHRHRTPENEELFRCEIDDNRTH